MFGLIRRISYSVIPRPDRPWEDDPTSNAPNTRRKRRLSSTEREARDGMDEENARKKKLRGDSENLGSDDATGTLPGTNGDAGPTPRTETVDGEKGEVTVQREGSLEVKVVTEGVKEVELEDKQPNPDPQPSATSDDQDAEGAAAATEDDVEETKDTSTDDKEEAVIPEAVKPEAIPLPEEGDESDDLRSSSPPQQEESTIEPAVQPTESAEAYEETPSVPIPDGPRLPRSAPRRLRSSSPKKVARV